MNPDIRRSQRPVTVVDLVRIKTELEFGECPAPSVISAGGGRFGTPPRLLIARTDAGYLRYIRESLPNWLAEDLLALEPEEAFYDSVLVQQVLDRHAPVEKITSVRWYTFDRAPAIETTDVSERSGTFVVVRDGRVASRARTELVNAVAAEVGVETDPDYRRRGYARQVVTAWVSDALERGLLPLYSHRIDNTASEQLGLGLGATLFSEEVEFG